MGKNELSRLKRSASVEEKRPLEVGWGVSDREGQILPTKIIFCPQSGFWI